MSYPHDLDKAIAKVAIDSKAGSRLKTLAIVLIVVGAVLCGFLYKQQQESEMFSFAWLWGFAFVWTVALGALFYVALHHLSGAVWSVVVRRVAEILARPIWIVALLFIPILLYCWQTDSHLFHWASAEAAHDEILQEKAGYLNQTFFTVRGVAFFIIWMLFARWFVGQSLKQDELPGLHAVTHRLRRFSGPFMLLFAFTVSFAGFDWLMSLDPHWFSTIFGVYVFAGMALASLATITLMVVWLNGRGGLGENLVRPEHLYSLGCLLFTFTCFWAYIWFSQFMLIWYGNLREETVWFAERGWGTINGESTQWLGASVILLFLRFIVPFALLLSRWSKMNPRMLTFICSLILVGQFWDLYWLIMPEAVAAHPTEATGLFSALPSFQLTLLGPALLMIGLLTFHVGWSLGKHRCLPVGDPLLEESCRFQLTI